MSYWGDVVTVQEGDSPILVAQPHPGTFVPEEIRGRFTKVGAALADTDWHIDRLYDGLLPGATTVTCRVSRYVIDTNRDPQGQSLYPGQNTTTLCPLVSFENEPLWISGQDPTQEEIETRKKGVFWPYHQALRAQLDRLLEQHSAVLLFDCHSIRSRLPFLFDGELPAANLGTNDSRTCDKGLEGVAVECCHRHFGEEQTVLNGRFKGGWTTRHYALPERGVHCLQLELAQRTYLAEEAPPWDLESSLARRTRGALRDLLQNLESELLTPS